MENRAYSVLQIRSVDQDQRVIEGWATTPDVDRVGDVIDPMGLTFAKTTPLLWQHDHRLPVGTVEFGKPTPKGVPFKAQIPKVEEQGNLRDRVEEAWQSVKYGIVTAVSIGFRALEGGAERMKEGGIRFTKAELMELSLVTVPANSQAVITAIKSIDQAQLSASGTHEQEEEEPGVSGVQKAVKNGSVKLGVEPKKRTPQLITVTK